MTSPRGTGTSLKNFPLFGPITAIVFAFLYVPLLFVIGYSFNSNRIVTVWKGFTFDWYVEVMGNDDIQRAVINSLRIAAISPSSMSP